IYRSISMNLTEASLLEQIVDRFEESWQAGPPPDIDRFVPATEPERRTVLERLIHVDLEYRLKAGQSVRVATYLERYPGLAGDAELRWRGVGKWGGRWVRSWVSWLPNTSSAAAKSRA